MAIKTANDQSMTAITSLPSGVNAQSMILLATETASSSATLDFTSDIDSTYKEYIFTFNNMHPATDAVEFEFQADTGTNTSYNQTITSTTFSAYHTEADDSAALSYAGGRDIAQGTTFQTLTHGLDNDNDSCCAGTLHIFNPSSTTFIKHFLITKQPFFIIRICFIFNCYF